MSAAARKKMAAAQKARWAKSRKTAKHAAPSAVAVSTAKAVYGLTRLQRPAKKRSISAGARARIAAAQKPVRRKCGRPQKVVTSTKVAK